MWLRKSGRANGLAELLQVLGEIVLVYQLYLHLLLDAPQLLDFHVRCLQSFLQVVSLVNDILQVIVGGIFGLTISVQDDLTLVTIRVPIKARNLLDIQLALLDGSETGSYFLLFFFLRYEHRLQLVDKL